MANCSPGCSTGGTKPGKWLQRRGPCAGLIGEKMAGGNVLQRDELTRLQWHRALLGRLSPCGYSPPHPASSSSPCRAPHDKTVLVKQRGRQAKMLRREELRREVQTIRMQKGARVVREQDDHVGGCEGRRGRERSRHRGSPRKGSHPQRPLRRELLLE